MVEHFSMAGLAFGGGETKELKEGLGRGEAREGGRASDFLRSIATRAALSCCGACASCASEEFSYAFLAAAAVGGDSLEEARP